MCFNCTTPMKALLDRHFGLNKFYGSAKGSLWKGKKIAIIATHGYDVEYGTGPFQTGIKRLCEHSNLEYIGMYSVRDEDDLASFQTEEAINGARDFAQRLLEILTRSAAPLMGNVIGSGSQMSQTRKH